MRKDIEIHINTGDITLPSNNKRVLRPFAWVNNPSGLMRYIYGEITVPGETPEHSVIEKGVYAIIPYTPIYKEFYIRIKRVNSDGSYSFVQNKTNGSEWFLVQCGKYGTQPKNIYASELITVSEDDFYVQIVGANAIIYSGSKSDLNVVNAHRQNANMLLKCIPTNNYRFPLTGVGLIRWTQSNIDHTSLSSILQREFSDDGVKVNSASYDFDTNDLNIDLDTANIT